MKKALGKWHGMTVEYDGKVITVGGTDFDDLRDLRDDLAAWLTRRGIAVPRYS